MSHLDTDEQSIIYAVKRPTRRILSDDDDDSDDVIDSSFEQDISSVKKTTRNVNSASTVPLIPPDDSDDERLEEIAEAVQNNSHETSATNRIKNASKGSLLENSPDSGSVMSPVSNEQTVDVSESSDESESNYESKLKEVSESSDESESNYVSKLREVSESSDESESNYKSKLKVVSESSDESQSEDGSYVPDEISGSSSGAAAGSNQSPATNVVRNSIEMASRNSFEIARDPDIVSDSSDVIEVSSDDERPPFTPLARSTFVGRKYPTPKAIPAPREMPKPLFPRNSKERSIPEQNDTAEGNPSTSKVATPSAVVPKIVPNVPDKTTVPKTVPNVPDGIMNPFYRSLPPKAVLPVAAKRTVSKEEYAKQQQNVQMLLNQLSQSRAALSKINFKTLADKGQSLRDRDRRLQALYDTAKGVLDDMTVDEASAQIPTAQQKLNIAWENLQAEVGAVGPRTFGKKGMAQFTAEKNLTVEALDNLHKSLKTCPTESDLAEDPRGLKITLMEHQKRALAWLMWREQQNPSGGLLADDMGLGKTLTMIALVMKAKEVEDEEEDRKEMRRGKYPGGTLVVCPASLLNQWAAEIDRRVKKSILSVEQYHGTKRETQARRLAKYDVVLTTYAIVMGDDERKGPAFGVRWRRVIIDEGHQIRNFKSKTAEAVCRVSARSRWALTGTPVHNKELDMYALLKFLRCTPFDDLRVWKHWVSDKSSGGQERLHAVISSLMLRRTKVELMASGSLNALPERTWQLIPVKLTKEETKVYQRVLIYSRTLMAQFLHQRAEKTQQVLDPSVALANSEYEKMRNQLMQSKRGREVKQHEILMLLLRLRQICCHTSLIIEMLNGDEDLGDVDTGDHNGQEDLLEQLSKMTLDEQENHDPNTTDAEQLAQLQRNVWTPSNPVFQKDYTSSKIRALIELILKVLETDDKIIVVSQWTSLLALVAAHLSKNSIRFLQLDGKVPVSKRQDIVDTFNDPKNRTKILLLSLTAGGVGLNLIGANHLFLLDLHWNPQLENQAQDRIYRVGQTKPINVYKFMAVDTIEERIKGLQENKLAIADNMLTGSKQISSSKLTLQDLRMLFDM